MKNKNTGLLSLAVMPCSLMSGLNESYSIDTSRIVGNDKDTMDTSGFFAKFGCKVDGTEVSNNNAVMLDRTNWEIKNGEAVIKKGKEGRIVVLLGNAASKDGVVNSLDARNQFVQTEDKTVDVTFKYGKVHSSVRLSAQQDHFSGVMLTLDDQGSITGAKHMKLAAADLPTWLKQQMVSPAVEANGGDVRATIMSHIVKQAMTSAFLGADYDSSNVLNAGDNTGLISKYLDGVNKVALGGLVQANGGDATHAVQLSHAAIADLETLMNTLYGNHLGAAYMNMIKQSNVLEVGEAGAAASLSFYDLARASRMPILTKSNDPSFMEFDALMNSTYYRAHPDNANIVAGEDGFNQLVTSNFNFVDGSDKTTIAHNNQTYDTLKTAADQYLFGKTMNRVLGTDYSHEHPFGNIATINRFALMLSDGGANSAVGTFDAQAALLAGLEVVPNGGVRVNQLVNAAAAVDQQNPALIINLDNLDIARYMGEGVLPNMANAHKNSAVNHFTVAKRSSKDDLSKHIAQQFSCPVWLYQPMDWSDAADHVDMTVPTNVNNADEQVKAFMANAGNFDGTAKSRAKALAAHYYNDKAGNTELTYTVDGNNKNLGAKRIDTNLGEKLFDYFAEYSEDIAVRPLVGDSKVPSDVKEIIQGTDAEINALQAAARKTGFEPLGWKIDEKQTSFHNGAKTLFLNDHNGKFFLTATGQVKVITSDSFVVTLQLEEVVDQADGKEVRTWNYVAGTMTTQGSSEFMTAITDKDGIKALTSIPVAGETEKMVELNRSINTLKVNFPESVWGPLQKQYDALKAAQELQIANANTLAHAWDNPESARSAIKVLQDFLNKSGGNDNTGSANTPIKAHKDLLKSGAFSANDLAILKANDEAAWADVFTSNESNLKNPDKDAFLKAVKALYKKPSAQTSGGNNQQSTDAGQSGATPTPAAGGKPSVAGGATTAPTPTPAAGGKPSVAGDATTAPTTGATPTPAAGGKPSVAGDATPTPTVSSDTRMKKLQAAHPGKTFITVATDTEGNFVGITDTGDMLKAKA